MKESTKNYLLYLIALDADTFNTYNESSLLYVYNADDDVKDDTTTKNDQLSSLAKHIALGGEI